MSRVLLEQFDKGNLEERAALVWDHGEFIVRREYYGNIVNLYALPGFYAEVYFCRKEEKIFRVDRAEDLEKFVPFLTMPE